MSNIILQLKIIKHFRDQTFLELAFKSGVHVSVNKQICTAGHKNTEKCCNGKTSKI